MIRCNNELSAAQQVLLEAMAKGATVRAACRQAGVSGSTPYRWAALSAPFATAFRAPLQYRARAIRGEWVEQLLADLNEQGFVADLDQRGKEDLRVCLFRFFCDRGLLEPSALRRTYNRSPVARDEQRRIVEAYVAAKAAGATDNQSHEFLAAHGVSKFQISRWAKQYMGPGALQVGPWANGGTRRRILDALRGGPLTAAGIATQTDSNHITIRSQARNLIADGLVIKSTRAGRVFYAAA